MTSETIAERRARLRPLKARLDAVRQHVSERVAIHGRLSLDEFNGLLRRSKTE